MGIEWCRVEKRFVKLIPLTIFKVIYKEINMRAFEGLEIRKYRLRDKWFNYFEFFVLGYDTIMDDDFEDIIDTLTIL